MCSAVLLILGTWTVTRVASETRQANDRDEYWEFAHVFNEVFHTIKNNYVEEVESEVLFRGALEGMFRALDDHSAFMGSDSFSQLEKETEGEFSGVGLHITLRDGVLTVIAPIPGGPAGRMGVQPWDRISEIDGTSTKDIELTEAVRKLTGPRGTKVKVKIWRPGMTEPEELEITRDRVKIQSVFHQLLEGDVGYIRISKFADKASREVLTALNELRDQGAKGLIIDMRFNPGGLLNEAVLISDLFLPRNAMIVSTRGRDGVVLDEHKAKSDAVTDMPIMIMINRGSASASEIVTAALRDNDRATVVGPEGENTFGKGSVQTISPLRHSFEKDEDGNYLAGAIKITTALYYTPKGETIHKVGIKPDIGVKLPEGHNRELLTRGMLGDPDLRGPENKQLPPGMEPEPAENATPGEEKPKTESQEGLPLPVDPANPDGEVPFFMLAPGTGEEAPEATTTTEVSADFRDVMLDETVRLVKAKLVLNGQGAQ